MKVSASNPCMRLVSSVFILSNALLLSISTAMYVVYLPFVSLYFSQVGDRSFRSVSTASLATVSKVLVSVFLYFDEYLAPADFVLSIIFWANCVLVWLMALSRDRLMLLDVALAQARKKALSDFPYSEHGVITSVFAMSLVVILLLLLHDENASRLIIKSDMLSDNFIMQIYKKILIRCGRALGFFGFQL